MADEQFPYCMSGRAAGRFLWVPWFCGPMDLHMRDALLDRLPTHQSKPGGGVPERRWTSAGLQGRGGVVVVDCRPEKSVPGRGAAGEQEKLQKNISSCCVRFRDHPQVKATHGMWVSNGPGEWWLGLQGSGPANQGTVHSCVLAAISRRGQVRTPQTSKPSRSITYKHAAFAVAVEGDCVAWLVQDCRQGTSRTRVAFSQW
ncbi:hypothetical protein M011DRAFT_217998 [Sporormia fimetaria CBS 119925]|uniref:Uncharacterized protein n=1 Tax=Sporormia fimetaria CBS 119925 TaxID=1340428 RepID=A0A6A6UZ08_9PLEO|nr:hypothetical protein M011DRAFT_217998 [Sporormia fimetaria CBS 119925]